MFQTVPLSIIRSFTVHTAIAVCTVKLLMMDRNCLKHVEFYSKNEFEKLVHLDGFIIRIYHDAWSLERQNPRINFTKFCDF